MYIVVSRRYRSERTKLEVELAAVVVCVTLNKHKEGKIRITFTVLKKLHQPQMTNLMCTLCGVVMKMRVVSLKKIGQVTRGMHMGHDS